MKNNISYRSNKETAIVISTLKAIHTHGKIPNSGRKCILKQLFYRCECWKEIHSDVFIWWGIKLISCKVNEIISPKFKTNIGDGRLNRIMKNFWMCK